MSKQAVKKRPATKARSAKKPTPKTAFLSHAHSGRLRAHRHTSYGALFGLLLLTALPMVVASRTVAYAALDGGDEYRTYAVVQGPAPQKAPTITSLRSGQTLNTTDPVTVAGACQTGTMVRVFKNEILAGATFCKGGNYSLPIDLFIGNNTVIARSYTANEAVSPDSVPVGVLLQVNGISAIGTAAPGTPGAPSNQFYITSQVFYRGVNANQPISWTVSVNGGQAPYAVSVDWGDGKTDLLSRGTAGAFDISHTYSKPGNDNSYKIVVKGSDQTGAKSFLQFVGVVSGDKPAASVTGGVKQGYQLSAVIRTAWQTLGVSVLVVAAFFIGERHELKLFRKGRII